MKICCYTMVSDTGFAPNPFHGWCTLAACTPNRMNAQLKKGDWIAGFFTDDNSPCLVCAMQVDEVLDFNAYYCDMRFQKKKPVLTGSAKDRCGDNLYHRDSDGNWMRDVGPYHQDDHSMEKDTRYAVVYAANVFTYFGGNAYSHPLPQMLRSVFDGGRGIRYMKEDAPLFPAFLEWLRAMPKGVQGLPRDFESGRSCAVDSDVSAAAPLACNREPKSRRA